MTTRVKILSKNSIKSAIEWVAREGANADFRVERALAQDEIGGLVDAFTRDIPARWTGSGSAREGLRGVADIAAIKNLLQNGVLPTGEEVRSPQVQKAAFSLIISAPKTVSILQSSEDPYVRAAVDKAIDAGEEAAMAVLEKMLRSRTGSSSKGMKMSISASGLVAMSWGHKSSSTGDPHAHRHVFILSTVRCPDGKWRAIDASIMLPAIRLAHAAATKAIERSLSKALDLSAKDWTSPLMAGSVQYRELSLLQRFIKNFSGAKDHMIKILERNGRTMNALTASEHDALWRLHREDKEILAEKVEREIDRAIAAGGSARDQIFEYWNKTGGGGVLKFFTKKFRPSKNPKPDLSPARLMKAKISDEIYETLIENLRKDRFSIIETAHFEAGEIREISARIAHEEKSFLGKFLPIISGQREIRLHDERAHLAVLKKNRKILQSDIQKIDEKISILRRNHKRWEEIEGKCLAWLDTQHGWIFMDLAAWLMSEIGGDAHEITLIAAHFLDQWAEKSLIKSPIPGKITPIIEAMMGGDDMPPTKIYSVIGTNSKFVTKMALKIEEDFAQKITHLTTHQRMRLKIAIDGLDPDQKKAAEKIAMGKKFLPISGVAGAGKSFLMKRVADAAREAGLPVYATARNRKRAQETGDDVGARGDAVFSVAAIEKYLTEAVRQRGGLLIIDEAALIDREDWEKITKLIENSNFQVVAIGDRYQAQSIDRKGIWHIAHQAAGAHSATLFASRRCQNWRQEHDFLRNGGVDFLPIAEKEGRILPKIAAAAPGWIAQKILDTPGAIAVTATNAEAAEISAAVQKKMEIVGKISCRYGCKIGIGDKIRTRKNERSLFVTNGDEFLVEKIHADGSVRAKSMKNPSKSVTLPPAYLAENAELAYTSTIDSAQGITVRQAIVCVTGAMGRSALYSGATRGTEAPIYVMTGTASMAEAEAALTSALARDDIAASLREIGEKADLLRDQQKTDEPAPAAVTAGQGAAKAVPPPPLPLDLAGRLAAIRAREAEKKARKRAAMPAPSGQDPTPEMAPRPRF